MSKAQKITVRVTGETREALERLAAEHDRSVSWHVQRALEAYLNERMKIGSSTDEDRS